MISPSEPDHISAAEAQAAQWCMLIAERPLSFEEQQDLDRWMAADPAHAAQFEQMVAVWQYTDAIAELPGFLSLRAKALEAMEAAQVAQRPTPWYQRGKLQALAACLLLVALFNGWNWHNSPDIYATQLGERRHVQLADGSSVTLDADSQISVRFSDQRRAIHLDKGRARFDVAKDPMRPFAVTAATQAVVAVGTSFSVELLQDQLHVTMFEGEVAILSKQQVASASKSLKSTPAAANLTVGQELVANLRSGATKIQKTNIDRAQSWENGRIDFIDIPLATAVERMNRYSDTPIIIADAATRRMLVNGVFDASDQHSFLVGLTSLYPLEYKTEESTIVISKDR